MRRWTHLLLALGLFGAGCAVSPQPSPPNLQPQGIELGDGAPELSDSALVLVGQPGTVDPPEGVVVATALDGTDPPRVEPVRADGSFSITSRLDGELRLQVRSGSARSAPLDLVLGGSGVTPAPRPLESCIRATAAGVAALAHDFGDLRVGAATELLVTLTNRCDSELALSARLRTDSPAFRLMATLPETLPMGASITIPVRAEPAAPGVYEDTLLVDVSAPVTDRRALTLLLRTPSE